MDENDEKMKEILKEIINECDDIKQTMLDATKENRMWRQRFLKSLSLTKDKEKLSMICYVILFFPSSEMNKSSPEEIVELIEKKYENKTN